MNSLLNVECMGWWWVGMHTNTVFVYSQCVCLCQVCARYQHFYNIWRMQGDPDYMYSVDDLATYVESDAFQQFAGTMVAGATNENTQSELRIVAIRQMKPQLPRAP